LLVEWAWPRLDPAARRLMTVLAQLTGDHAGIDSLLELANLGRSGASSLDRLQRWHLVQEPFRGRFALHAVVRHAIRRIAGRKTASAIDAKRIVRHYLALLEQHPERFDLEQTHLFAAMDFAHATSDLGGALRIDRLLRTLANEGVTP